mmetsp:Transcript_20925/g.27030  ORF Transcript_20925/g.27030 Transcript_20925/m.27030 type:complete len:86 (-) Transcript_20925:316-573(-)
MEDFLSNEDKGLFLDKDKKTIKLSKIFSWYSKDFEQDGVSLLDYITPYVNNDVKSFIQSHKDEISIEYFDYNWKVNGNLPPCDSC